MAKHYLKSDLNFNDNTKVRTGLLRRMSLRIGKIKAVYPEENTVDIQWLYPLNGQLSKLDLSRPYVGFRSGINFMPEVGSIITVGYSEDLPVILSYSLPSSFSNMIQGVTSSTLGYKTKIRRIDTGEINIYSKQDSEIYLHDKVEILDKNLDQIVIDPEDGSINFDSLQLYINNEAGSISMGMIERNGDIITDDGQDISTINGGNALTELKIKINKLADNSINTSSISNPTLAEVTIGTLVDDDGNKTLSDDNTEIQLEVKMKSGLIIRFDENGKMFVDTKNIKLINEETIKVNSNKININDAKENVSANSSKQSSAREGDKITVPIAGVTDQEHPNIIQKQTNNQATLASSIPMCFKVFGVYPVVFTPSATDFKLEGEITNGSKTVFVGD